MFFGTVHEITSLEAASVILHDEKQQKQIKESFYTQTDIEMNVECQ